MWFLCFETIVLSLPRQALQHLSEPRSNVLAICSSNYAMKSWHAICQCTMHTQQFHFYSMFYLCFIQDGYVEQSVKWTQELMERGWEADSIIWNSCISACKKGSQQLGLAALQKAQIADPACGSSCCCCFLPLVNLLHICKECCRFVFCSGICRATWLNYSVGIV